MAEWVYKTTASKVGYHETLRLAMTRHFLCRSAVERKGSQPDRVGEIAIGDIIHFYCTIKDDKVATYGSFRVVDGDEHTTQFSEQIENTALFKVREDEDNAAMIKLLTEEHDNDPKRGYVRDPTHGCFTGWVVKRLDSKEMKPPSFNQKKLFPGPQVNLWSYPDPELPRPRVSNGASRSKRV
jgi:hypothetical protein